MARIPKMQPEELARIRAWLDDHGWLNNRACSCGALDWSPADSYYAAIACTSDGQINLQGEIHHMLLVALVCMNCGITQFVSARSVGLA